MTDTPAPCRDCGKMTWCLRQLCPWCEQRRKEKSADEYAESMKRPLYRTKVVTETDCKVSGIGKAIADADEHKLKIDDEGMGLTLADG